MTGGEVFALEQVFRLRPFLFHRSLRARRDDYHRRMIPASLLFVALSMSLPAASGTSAVAATGEQTSVMFTACSPFSRSTELVRRLLSPLNAWRVLEVSRRAGHALREQPLDVGQQRFSLYVPRHAPPGGYALLVFVPPWNSATVPSEWKAPLDRHGMIYISAANSGNAADVLDRRVPLALLAAWNIMQRYRVDPRRIYVGGLSGGSRVAERVALGYPDLFGGALLIAGSDPVGTAQLALPPVDLFRRFQQHTKLVYLTGQNDPVNLELDARGRQSMHDFCVFHLTTVAEPWVGHELPVARSLERALDRLYDPVQVDADRLARCREGVDKKLNARLQQVRGLLIARKFAAARAQLERIDSRYGGLAAPQSVALASEIDAAGATPQAQRRKRDGDH
jgi:pimeloyl-ACP methyl ester carboxylesterase